LTYIEDTCHLPGYDPGPLIGVDNVLNESVFNERFALSDHALEPVPVALDQDS
jgi:hypothetical protein